MRYYWRWFNKIIFVIIYYIIWILNLKFLAFIIHRISMYVELIRGESSNKKNQENWLRFVIQVSFMTGNQINIYHNFYAMNIYLS